MDIVPSNMERRSCHSDDFINFWVPIIRKMRETTQWAGINFYPSMNDCVEIVAGALKDWAEKQKTINAENPILLSSTYPDPSVQIEL